MWPPTAGCFPLPINGQSWAPRDYDLAATFDGTIAATAVTVSQVDHTVVYATTGQPSYLYKSTDAAGTWKILNPTYPGEPMPNFINYPMVFTLVTGGSDLYVVDTYANLVKSSDGGATWQKGAGQLFNARAIRVDPANPSTIFVLDGAGLQKSTDGGQTFATVNPTGVQGINATAFAYESGSQTLYLAAGSIYASPDEGGHWQVAPVSSANFHVLQAIGGRMFVGLDTPQTTFLVKFDPTGTQLLYSTFFTGRPMDGVTALQVDAQGSAYLAGNTISQNFAGTVQLSPPSPPASFTSFVAKVKPDCSNLVWLSVFGGSRSAFTQGLAIDATGAAYVTGYTTSSDFSTTPNALQSKIPTAACTRPMDSLYFRSPNTQLWAFALKVSADGNLVYSTFVTGACGSTGQGIAVNPAGEAFVVGSTTSPDMPVSTNAYQGAFPGPLDKTVYPNAYTSGFVVRLSAAGDQALGGTYVGGGYESQVNAIVLDASGNPAMTGSTWGIAPGATAGAYQTAVRYQCAEPFGIGPAQPPVNGADAFVLKLDPALSKAGYLTYLGGECYDSGHALALDPAGNVWVTGGTNSADFPLKAPYEDGGGTGGFVSELSADGSKLLFSSFSDGIALAVDNQGFAYVAGSTVLPVIAKPSFTTSASVAKIGPAANSAVILNSFAGYSASSGASGQPGFAGSVAPGELIQINGQNLGPATKVNSQLDSGGRLPFTLANTRVMFDSFPAALLSVQDTNVVCVVPFAVSAPSEVTVISNGQGSNTVRIGVTPSLPQILAVANQDGTANSAANPALQGSVIVVYVTGLGQTNPPGIDGQITSVAATPVVPVTAFLGGTSSPPQFVGAAAGLVAGITQVNVRVPAGAYQGGQTSVSINSAAATLYVK